MANEKLLIDANVLLDEFLKQYTERERKGNLVFAACEIKQDFADMISNVPNMDAVEVVRCRDCKHRYNGKDCTHPLLLSYSFGAIRNVKDDDFCSYGERKDCDD